MTGKARIIFTRDSIGGISIEDNIELDLDGLPLHYDGKVVGQVIDVTHHEKTTECIVRIDSPTIIEKLRTSCQKAIENGE